MADQLEFFRVQGLLTWALLLLLVALVVLLSIRLHSLSKQVSSLKEREEVTSKTIHQMIETAKLAQEVSNITDAQIVALRNNDNPAFNRLLDLVKLLSERTHVHW
jgi:hypothetical protein